MGLLSVLRYFSELLSVAIFYTVAFLGGMHIIGLCFILLIFTRLWPIVVLYVGWTVLFEWSTPKRGGRPHKEFMRKLPLFNFMRDYFPISLEKTADLDPQRNYIFGYHPHAYISEGAVVAFQTDALGFRDKYPGIEPHMTVHSSLLNGLLYRDIILSLGFLDVSKGSLLYALTQKGPGHSVVIVVGGAAEIISTHKDCYVLTLKNRKGFIRLALETGSPLVPVFGFGQNNVYTTLFNVPGSLYSRLQQWVSNKTKQYGVRLAFFFYFGLFGFIPWRTPIDVVVGSPIPVVKVAKPTDSEVDELHTNYMEKLRTLFDSHRDKYGVPKETKLTFI